MCAYSNTISLSGHSTLYRRAEALQGSPIGVKMERVRARNRGQTTKHWVDFELVNIQIVKED